MLDTFSSFCHFFAILPFFVIFAILSIFAIVAILSSLGAEKFPLVLAIYFRKKISPLFLSFILSVFQIFKYQSKFITITLISINNYLFNFRSFPSSEALIQSDISDLFRKYKHC